MHWTGARSSSRCETTSDSEAEDIRGLMENIEKAKKIYDLTVILR